MAEKLPAHHLATHHHTQLPYGPSVTVQNKYMLYISHTHTHARALPADITYTYRLCRAANVEKKHDVFMNTNTYAACTNSDPLIWAM